MAALCPASVQLKGSSALGCLFFMTDVLVTSSSVTGWMCPLAGSWSSCFIKNAFSLWDQRSSSKLCQGYNLSHVHHLVLAKAAWIGRRPVLGLWNWELNSIFSNLWVGTFQRVYSSEINILVLITRVCFCFPKTSYRHRTVLFRLLPCLKITLMPLKCLVCFQMADLQQEHQREIEGLLENIRQLSRELRLQILIIDNFIPQDYQVKAKHLSLGQGLCCANLSSLAAYFLKGL